MSVLELSIDLEEINFVPTSQPINEESFYLTGFIVSRAKFNSNNNLLEDENIREFNNSLPNLKMYINHDK